jgi:leader peptidase (prepilin peptidase)/N-methyltransferase
MTEVPALFLAIVFTFGLVIGSFLNVVIFRMPRQLSFARGRSACPHCGHLIAWYQNIPLASFLALRGRCAACGGRISPRYPAVELITGLAFLGWVWRLGFTVEAFGYIYLSSILIAVFFIDWEFQIIPDRLTYPSLAVGLVWSYFAPLGIVDSLIGGAVGGVGLLAVALAGDWLFKKESMGGGDIKLAAVLGSFLGWRLVVLVFFLSAFLGAVVSIVWLLVSREMRQKRLIPFGPFLALAAVIAAIWGPQLIRWYLHSFWLA